MTEGWRDGWEEAVQFEPGSQQFECNPTFPLTTNSPPPPNSRGNKGEEFCLSTVQMLIKGLSFNILLKMGTAAEKGPKYKRKDELHQQ